jgi:hypothetical protein
MNVAPMWWFFGFGLIELVALVFIFALCKMSAEPMPKPPTRTRRTSSDEFHEYDLDTHNNPEEES